MEKQKTFRKGKCQMALTKYDGKERECCQMLMTNETKSRKVKGEI